MRSVTEGGWSGGNTDGFTNQSSNKRRGRSVLPVAALRQKDTRETRTNNNINNSNYSGNNTYQNMQ